MSILNWFPSQSIDDTSQISHFIVGDIFLFHFFSPWNPHQIPWHEILIKSHFPSIFPPFFQPFPVEKTLASHSPSVAPAAGRWDRCARGESRAKRSERPSSRGPWRPQLGDFLLTLGISWDFTDWPWDIWVISYYSWDNFDEKKYCKKHIEMGIIGISRGFHLPIFSMEVLPKHMDWSSWISSLTPRFCGQTWPANGWDPKESEGIRRLVSWLSSPSRWDGWYHVIIQVFAQLNFADFIMRWTCGYPFFLYTAVGFPHETLFACSSNRRHPQATPPVALSRSLGSANICQIWVIHHAMYENYQNMLVNWVASCQTAF